MALVVSARSPDLCLIFRYLEMHVGSFGIESFDAIHPRDGFDHALLGEPPNISRKRRRFVHQLVAVVVDEIAVKLGTVLFQESGSAWSTAPPPEDRLHARMLIEKLDHGLRNVRTAKLFRELSLFFRRFVAFRVHEIV